MNMMGGGYNQYKNECRMCGYKWESYNHPILCPHCDEFSIESSMISYNALDECIGQEQVYSKKHEACDLLLEKLNKMKVAINYYIKNYGCHPDFDMENCGFVGNGCPFNSFCVYYNKEHPDINDKMKKSDTKWSETRHVHQYYTKKMYLDNYNISWNEDEESYQNVKFKLHKVTLSRKKWRNRFRKVKEENKELKDRYKNKIKSLITQLEKEWIK